MTCGKFIAIEGGEGAGKSTQAKRLKARLENEGIRVRLTREPGGSDGAEEIRKLLVEGAPDRWLPMSEALLFFAARYDHIQRLIKPALAAGEWVISDRFGMSSEAYQGSGRGLGWAMIRSLESFTLDDFRPDLSVIIDISPDEGLARAKARGGAARFERFPFEFHEAIRSAYQHLAVLRNCPLIEADGADRDEIEVAIWEHVEPLVARARSAYGAQQTVP